MLRVGPWGVVDTEAQLGAASPRSAWENSARLKPSSISVGVTGRGRPSELLRGSSTTPGWSCPRGDLLGPEPGGGCLIVSVSASACHIASGHRGRGRGVGGAVSSSTCSPPGPEAHSAPPLVGRAQGDVRLGQLGVRQPWSCGEVPEAWTSCASRTARSQRGSFVASDGEDRARYPGRAPPRHRADADPGTAGKHAVQGGRTALGALRSIPTLRIVVSGRRGHASGTMAMFERATKYLTDEEVAAVQADAGRGRRCLAIEVVAASAAVRGSTS